MQAIPFPTIPAYSEVTALFYALKGAPNMKIVLSERKHIQTFLKVITYIGYHTIKAVLLENRLTDMVCSERVGCMEKVPWKHTPPYVQYIANGTLLYDSGNSNWGSVTGEGVGGGREVQEGGSRWRGRMYTCD